MPLWSSLNSLIFGSLIYREDDIGYVNCGYLRLKYRRMVWLEGFPCHGLGRTFLLSRFSFLGSSVPPPSRLSFIYIYNFFRLSLLVFPLFFVFLSLVFISPRTCKNTGRYCFSASSGATIEVFREEETSCRENAKYQECLTH